MTAVGIFCFVVGIIALWCAWNLRGLWGSVFGLILAAAYFAVGVSQVMS